MPKDFTFDEILVELEKMGINVAEFRKMKTKFSIAQTEELRKQLLKILQSRITQDAYKRLSAADIWSQYLVKQSMADI